MSPVQMIIGIIFLAFNRCRIHNNSGFGGFHVNPGGFTVQIDMPSSRASFSSLRPTMSPTFITPPHRT
jgi:hypothetical protein